MPFNSDSYLRLREALSWRVAVVLGALIIVLMLVLGLLNTRLGLHDTALLSWWVLGVTSTSVLALFVLPRKTGAQAFFMVIAAALVVTVAFGIYQGRSTHHWGYLFPMITAILWRPTPALIGMVIYGVYVVLISTQLIPMIDVVRFASVYGLQACFVYTYALLQERTVALLHFHSNHDALSNCLNRRNFNERLQIMSVQGVAGQRACFLLIDIDHFKRINDQHGHLLGDQIIRRIADVLKSVVSPETLVYRYGGEEFAVILVASAERTGVALAERLRTEVSSIECEGVRTSISIGVAEWRQGTGSVISALDDADRALYAAKNAGRNCVVAASTLV